MDSPAVGNVRLYDDVRSALPAGAYRIGSRAAVTQTGGGPLEPAPDHRLGIMVTAPRFSLGATDVLACQPPAGFRGDVRTRLPHIALSRRSLPWERPLADGTPWLALLVLTEEEAAVEAERPLREAVGDAMFARLAEDEPIDGNGPLVSVLRLRDRDVLTGIWPTRRDVRLLTHVRHVNLADSELARLDDDGWIAVVTANRLPTTAGRWTANLVSLEAQEALWAGTPAEVPPLVLLFRWAFETSSAGGFEDLVTNLSAAPIGGPEGKTLVSLTRAARSGLTYPVRYRSPLAPFAAGDDAPAEPAADDVTMAAARELGRLLAIADVRFLRELVSWQRTAQLAQTRSAFARPLADALQSLSAPEARRAATRRTAVPRTASLDELRTAALARIRATAAPTADTYGARPPMEP